MLGFFRLAYHFLRIVFWRQFGFFDVSRFMLSGEWTGDLDLDWIGPRLWRVSDRNTSTFHRSDGSIWIAPKELETDLASIPEFLWSLPGFSPQWYARSAVLHDWRFQTHHDKGNPWDESGFDDANAMLAECIYVEMLESKSVSLWRLWLYYEAVEKFGREVWNGQRQISS